MKTIVIGASTNPSRYSHTAVTMLEKHGHEVIPLGIKKGEINGKKIINNKAVINNVHTITLYISPKLQLEYYDYILNILKPKRVIFNPGTINPEFMKILKDNNIEVVDACTLVLLSTNQY